jgi:hypothetical protein
LPDLSRVRQEFAHVSSGLRPAPDVWQRGTLAEHLAQDLSADRAQESHRVEAPRELIPLLHANDVQDDPAAGVQAQLARDEEIIQEFEPISPPGKPTTRKRSRMKRSFRRRPSTRLMFFTRNLRRRFV